MSSPEDLRKGMTAAGDRLIEALENELEQASLLSRRVPAAGVRRWIQSRKSVEDLALDYLAKVDRYRQTVQAVFFQRAG